MSFRLISSMRMVKINSNSLNNGSNFSLPYIIYFLNTSKTIKKAMSQSDHVNSDKNTHSQKLLLDFDPIQQKKAGYWNFSQHKLYVIFVDFFRKQLSSKGKRRDNRIFKVMASFLKSRNAIQCRSHHIKLLRTYKCNNNIVKNLRQRIGNQNYYDLFKSVTAEYKIFDRKSDEYQRWSNKKIIDGIISYSKSVGVQTDDLEFYPSLLEIGHEEHKDEVRPDSYFIMEYQPLYFYYSF